MYYCLFIKCLSGAFQGLLPELALIHNQLFLDIIVDNPAGI